MPTYAYLCSECGHQFDVFHSYKDRLTDCEKCDTIGTLAKMLNKPIQLVSSATRNKDSKEKVGTKVNEAIEDNKQSLEELKKDMYKRTNPNG